MNDPFANIPDELKHMVDALSVATALGTLLSWLPNISCLLTIIWLSLRIYETKTVQTWLRSEEGQEP